MSANGNDDNVIGNTGFIDRLVELGGNNTAAAIFAGMQCGTAELKYIEERPYMLVPDGMELVPCDSLLPAPLRITSTRTFEEPDSFCTYVETFQTDKTRLYGSFDNLKIVAALDDHQPGQPSWVGHQAALELKRSPEFKEWQEACNKKVGQQDLADFLDDHMEQIAEPDSGDLLNDIRAIHISTNTKCDFVQREGGDIAFAFSTDSQAGTKTERGKIPSKLTLLIAPFRSWHPIQVTVSLTYSLSKERELFFVMRMHQIEAVIGASFTNVKGHVQEKLGLPVLL